MGREPGRPPLFERLKTALQEGIQFAQGEFELNTSAFPNEPPKVKSEEILQLRQQLGLSQSGFARLMNVSSRTIQYWEQGERTPAQAALRLLEVLKSAPELVCRISGLSLAETTTDPDPARRTGRRNFKNEEE